jgi:hypothetical protein
MVDSIVVVSIGHNPSYKGEGLDPFLVGYQTNPPLSLLTKSEIVRSTTGLGTVDNLVIFKIKSRDFEVWPY